MPEGKHGDANLVVLLWATVCVFSRFFNVGGSHLLEETFSMHR